MTIILTIILIYSLKDDKKSSVDPSEYKNEEGGDLSESESSETPLCDSPDPSPSNLALATTQLVYAKSNAVKEQIRHKNGKVVNKKGKKPMSK